MKKSKKREHRSLTQICKRGGKREHQGVARISRSPKATRFGWKNGGLWEKWCFL